MKKTRKALSLVLALVLIVGTFSAFAGIVSAKVNKTGTKSTASGKIGTITLSGSVACYSNRATGSTSISSSGSTITVEVCLEYRTPASPTDLASIYTEKSNSTSNVNKTVYNPDTSLYTSIRAFAAHESSLSSTVHLETYDAA